MVFIQVSGLEQYKAQDDEKDGYYERYAKGADMDGGSGLDGVLDVPGLWAGRGRRRGRRRSAAGKSTGRGAAGTARGLRDLEGDDGRVVPALVARYLSAGIGVGSKGKRRGARRTSHVLLHHSVVIQVAGRPRDRGTTGGQGNDGRDAFRGSKGRGYARD